MKETTVEGYVLATWKAGDTEGHDRLEALIKKEMARDDMDQSEKQIRYSVMRAVQARFDAAEDRLRKQQMLSGRRRD